MKSRYVKYIAISILTLLSAASCIAKDVNNTYGNDEVDLNFKHAFARCVSHSTAG